MTSYSRYATLATAVIVAAVLIAYASYSSPPALPSNSSTFTCAVTTTNSLGQKTTYACDNQAPVSLNSTQGDTFLTRCVVTGVGGFQLRIITDSTGAPVSGETINAVDRLGCGIVGQAAETQVVHLANFPAAQGGWLVPVFPNQATAGGQLSFTVAYRGGTYNFSAAVPLIGTSCVTLHVPSGSVTTETMMNGPCPTPQSNNAHNTISVTGLSICPSNCIYPAPHVSAEILVNGNVPISTVVVYVNDSFDGFALQNPTTTTFTCSTAAGKTCSIQVGGSGFSNGTSTTITRYYATCTVPANSTSCITTATGSVNMLTRFIEEYKGSVPNNMIPVVSGDMYVFTFVATFQDGTTSTVTVSAVAT